MSKRYAPAVAGDTLPIEEPGAPVDAWTLDELDQFGELASLRPVWTDADDSGN
jgi:hypothetical protein